MLKSVINGQLMKIEHNDYEYEGRKGVSHRLVLYCDGVLHKVSIKGEECKEYEQLIGQDIKVPVGIYIKGQFNLALDREF